LLSDGGGAAQESPALALPAQITKITVTAASAASCRSMSLIFSLLSRTGM
jgi:hypothetical protein